MTPDWAGRVSRWCFGATLVLAPMNMSWTPNPVLPRVYPSDVPVGAGIVLWFVHHWRCPDRPLCLPSRPVLIGLAGLILTGVTSTPGAFDPGLALDLSLRTLIAVGVVCWATDLQPRPSDAAWALLLSGAIQGLVGLVQFIVGGSIGLKQLGEIPFGHFGGLDATRVFGLTPHPNILGGIAGIGVLAGAGLVVLNRQTRWPYTVPALGLAAAGVAGSLSRSAFLGFGAGFLVLGLAVWSTRGRRAAFSRVVAVVVTVLLVFVVVRPEQYGQRTVGILIPSTNDAAAFGERADIDQRIAQHVVAFRMIRQNLLLGVGPGGFMDAWRHLGNAPAVPVLPVHDIALLIFAEQGVVGLGSWLLLYTGVAYRAVRTWSDSTPDWRSVWLSSLAMIVVVGFFDFYFWEWEQGRLIWAGVLGMWESSRL
jgi:O-antigen ligase